MNKQFNHRLSLVFALAAILIEYMDMKKIDDPFEFIFVSVVATGIYYGIARISIKLTESLIGTFKGN